MPVRVWHVYMIRCADGSLYTGISTDVERRLGEHRNGSGKGAKYLRGRGPLGVVLSRAVGDRRSALKVEAKLKRSAKKTKEALVADPSGIDPWLTGDA
jgi:putative endonuclease